MLSDLPFGAFLAYCPRGDGESHRASQQLVRQLKRDQVVGTPPRPVSRILVERLAERLASAPFRDWFGQDVVLVPAPRSARLVQGGLWVPERLARAMVGSRIGGEVSTCLERTIAVPKAAFASGQERPTADRHFETIAVRRELGQFRRVVIVDDVVTRGATLLGAAGRLREAYPGIDVRGFAAIRTVSDPNEFRAVVEPVAGHIEFRDGETYRRP